MAHRARWPLAVGLLLLSLGCDPGFTLPQRPGSEPGADTTPPSLSDFRVEPEEARAGTSLTFAFQASEPLPPSARTPGQNPEVKVGGVPMLCEPDARAANAFRCTAVVVRELEEGEARFTVQVRDAAGNDAQIEAPVTVRIDYTAPVLTTAPGEPLTAKGKSTPVTVTSSEPLSGPPTLEGPFDSPPQCAGAGTSFLCTAQVSLSAPRGDVYLVARGRDRAGNEGASPAAKLSVVDPAPVVKLDALQPAVARPGDIVTIAFSADWPLIACQASVAGRPAQCGAPLTGACVCSWTAESAVQDGALAVSVTGTGSGGSASASGTLIVDSTGPKVDAAALALVRHALGQNDGVSAAAGAFADEGPTYSGKGVRKVTVWSDASMGTALASGVPAADGSLQELALPSTDGSAGHLAPKRLWLSAEDGLGNASARVEIAKGRDDAAPTGDGAKLEIVRRDATLADQVRGAAGAFQSICALSTVEVFDAAGAGTSVVKVTAAPDGGFAATDVGTAASSFSRLWAEASNKCGDVSARVEFGVGADTAAPLLDGSLVTFRLSPAGTADEVEGAAGAVVDPGGTLIRVQAFDSATSTVALATLAADGTGAFPRTGVGDLSLDRVWLEAADKAGNLAARVPSRRVLARLTLDDRARGRPLPAALLRPLVTDADPRTLSPLAMLALAPAAPPTALAGAVTADATTFTTTAAPATTGTRRFRAAEPVPGGAPAMAWDSRRRKLVLFSSYVQTSLEEGTYENDGTGWRRVATKSAPSPRVATSMTYDARRGKVVLFGGNGEGPCDGNSQYCSATWEYDGSDWQKVQTAHGPSPRTAAALGYDPLRGKVVLFGGISAETSCDGSGSEACGATWEYDGSDWTQATLSTAPSPRAFATMAWDASRSALVMFGGATSQFYWSGPACDGASSQCGAWTYDGTWKRLVTQGATPSNRVAPALAYDSARKRLVLTGGYAPACDGGSASYCPLTWELDATGWAQVNTTQQPAVRAFATSAFDEARARFVLVGGSGSNNEFYSDTWEFDGTAWTQAQAFSRPPVSGTEWGRAVYDSARKVWVWVDCRASQYLCETYERSTGGWVKNNAGGTKPKGRTDFALTFDPDRKVVVMFGGQGQFCDAYKATPGAVCDDTWEYDGAWHFVVPHNRPSARFGHALVYDPALKKVLMHGGEAADGATCDGSTTRVCDGTWTYSFNGLWSDWFPVSTIQTKPSARVFPALTWDSARQKVVLFGGQGTGVKLTATEAAPPASGCDGNTAGQGFCSGTWEFDGSDWRQAVTTQAPQPRVQHGLAFDPRLKRTVLLGGLADGACNDGSYGAFCVKPWEWDGAAWTPVSLLAEIGRRDHHSFDWDASQQALVTVGGNLPDFQQANYMARYEGTQPGPRTAAHAFSFPVPRGASIVALTATWIGAARGDSSGVPAWSSELLAWDAAAGQWKNVGGHTAQASDAAALRTIKAGLPGSATAFVEDGEVWLLAAPKSPSSAPPGTVPSEVQTDGVELEATWTLP